MGEIKKPISKKILEIFVEEDIPQLKKDIWQFIIRPNIKSLAYQICLGIVNQTFKSKDTPASVASTNRSYDKAYQGNVQDFRTMTTGAKNVAKVKDWSNVIVSSPEDADKVVNNLRAYLNVYKKVSIADLFSEAEITCDDPIAHKWGWKNLDGISWGGELTGGYRIMMPSDPIPLKE